MSDPGRTYDSEEVRRIFADAADAEASGGAAHPTSSPSPLSSSDGLSLTELREIGEEVGLSGELVERAALALDSEGEGEPAEKMFGTPVTVRYQESLPGALSDEAWERLVVELREVFQATGATKRDGALRQWQNGNLRVFTEPTADGTRIRMQTTSGRMVGRISGGLMLQGMGALTSIFVWLREGLVPLVLVPALLVVVGVIMVVSARFAAPDWAETRLQQMKHIAGRAKELATPPALPAADGE